MRNIILALSLLVSTFAIGITAQSDGPPVKKSTTGICHPKGGTYYSRTRNYTPYNSMEACIQSGGRRPKR